MRKSTLIYSLSAVVILFLMIILFKTRSPFGKSNSDFTSRPVKEITRIEIKDNEEKLKIEKSGEEWLLNNRTSARKGGINFIVRILTEAKIKSPVSPELFKSEIIDKQISPVEVKVYEGRKLLKLFLVYKTNSNIYGNIMKIKESTKPFIVHVPGYEVNIGSIFTVREPYWQPYTIFNQLPSEINSVRLENLIDPSSSFFISRRATGYQLSDINGDAEDADTSLIIRYFSYFTFIPFEKWAFDLPDEEISALIKQRPVYRITLVSTNGSTIRLSLWHKMKVENGEQIVDTDRLLGTTDSNEGYFIVRYFDIDPILKKRSYFFDD